MWEMEPPRLDHLDRDVIESLLQMGEGYVLDFSDRTFAEFFAEFGVNINDPRFQEAGGSKAKRLRAFLRISDPEVVARVLAALLERRLLKAPDGAKEAEIARYRAAIARLRGEVSAAGASAARPTDPESELLRRAFDPEMVRRLPLDSPLANALVARMEEAHACIESGAFLSAVILCGSVLEGMCLGFGSRSPERANRAFSAHYKRQPLKFHEWKLSEWIVVLGKLGDLSPNIEKFGHALRDFRNYVHPAEQVAHGFTPDRHTARIGFQVVVAAIDDLERASAALRRAPPTPP
jgi:hypothetical protein